MTQPHPSDDTVRAQPVLRFVHGLHAGAERRCGPREVILIGSGDDCDLILSDEGVARHHCIVSVIGDAYSVRPLDAPVAIGTRTIALGEPIPFDAFAPVGIGAAAFAVGASDSERWQELAALMSVAPAARAEAEAKRKRSRKYVAIGLSGLAVCAVTVALTANTLHPPPKPDPGAQRAQVEQVLRGLDLDQIKVASNGRGGFLLRGQAPDGARVEYLRRDLAARAIPVDYDIRSGEDIAKDVHEVLRLSEIDAASTYRGPGEVEIKGHFGDGKALESVLASRAVKDIDGLVKVTVLNLDQPREERKPAPPTDNKRIVSMVGGKDPYVVTADGSRYFAGAELPCGGKLVAIENDELYVDTGTGVRPKEECKPRTALR